MELIELLWVLFALVNAYMVGKNRATEKMLDHLIEINKLRREK